MHMYASNSKEGCVCVRGGGGVGVRWGCEGGGGG